MGEQPPIFSLDMPGACWQLLWWLIARMDSDARVYGGWRLRASREMKRDRIWIQHCAETLREHNLIATQARERQVRVLVANFKG